MLWQCFLGAAYESARVELEGGDVVCSKRGGGEIFEFICDVCDLCEAHMVELTSASVEDRHARTRAGNSELGAWLCR